MFSGIADELAESVHFIFALMRAITVCVTMSEETRYYKGKYRVKVLTKSHGYWIVEALEPFEDVVSGEKVHVKVGERRIVAPNLLFKRRGLSPPLKEHVYELKMEKRLKRLIEEEEKKSETR
jgi:hypothetical protein